MNGMRLPAILSILLILSTNFLPSCLCAFVVRIDSVLLDRCRRGIGGRGFWRRGSWFVQCGEDLLFLEGEFLDDDRVGDGDFEDAAAEAAGSGVSGERLAGGGLPGGGEVGVGLDAAVAAGGDQLGEDVGDFFGSAGVVAALLAVAAGVRNRRRRCGSGALVWRC